MMTYETWVEAGRPEDAIDAAEWPEIYAIFFQRWPESFEFYRHNAFSYVSRTIGYMPLGTSLESLLRRVRTQHGAEYSEFIKVLSKAGPRFGRQRDQATRYLRNVPDPIDPLARLRSTLHGYAALYETDFPLWFLGVVGKALSGGSLDPTFLGGPETKTPQGALINAVGSVLKGTPLIESFSLAYDTELRNAIAHNDYELEEREGVISLIDHASGQRWTEDEAWQRIILAQYLHHAVVLAAQVAIADQDRERTEMADVGVLSFTWGGTFEGWPVVSLLQLWCFRDLDPAGEWIDATTLRLTTASDGATSHLTEAAKAEGAMPRSLEWDKADSPEWAWVVRSPVAPDLAIGHPCLRTTDDQRFEVVGPPDVHLVPLVVN